MLISGIGSLFVQSQISNIKLYKNETLPMPNGEKLSMDIYKPRNATSSHPAPAVITSHGYFDNKEKQDVTGIELARRGFVVFSMDMYHHGSSSGTHESYLRNREFYGLGMHDLVNFVHDDISYVNKNKIGITGHSTGGRNVSYALDAYGRNEKIHNGIKNGAHYKNEPRNADQYKKKISSALIMANVPEPYLLENIPKDTNVGIDLGYYDEGAPDELTKVKNHSIADLTVSPEIKNFINLVQPNTFDLKKHIDYQTSSKKPNIKLSDWNNNQKVKLGHFYGNVDKGNSRVVYNPKTFHPWMTISKTNSAIISDYFTKTLGAPNPIPKNDQIWQYKTFFNGLGVIGFFMFIIPFGIILLKTPLFASLINDEPRKLPELNKLPKKLTFTINLIIGTAIPGLTLMPFMSLNTWVFPNVSTQNTTNWFSQPSTNQIIIWMTLNAIIALILFAINYLISGRKMGVKPSQWGLKIGIFNFLKSILLAVVIATVSYSLVFFTEFIFKSDFRFWYIVIKTFDASKLLVMLKYLPFFLVFFFVNALIVNGLLRVSKQKPWINKLLAVLFNIVGIIIVIIVQYATLFATGQALWYSNLSWINILLAIPLVVGLILATLISRIFFEKTGSVYLGVFINSILLDLMVVTNTTTILPI